MKDHFGRNINYLRLSITDRCNLRCKYCMPHGVEFTPHEQILTYEEFLRVARAAVHLGIPRFKITGGEPLVRKGVTDFIAALKRLPGVEEVTLTTNGVRLAELVPALKAAGVDGVNISLDAADPETFQAITGFDQLGNVLAGLDASLAAGPVTRLWNRPWRPPSTKSPSPTALARVRSRNSTSWRPLAAENRKTSRILYLWESSKQFAFPKSGACRSTPSRKPT